MNYSGTSRCQVGDVDNGNSALISAFADAYRSLLSSSPIDCQKPDKLIRRFHRDVLTDARGYVAKMSSLADMLMQSCIRTSDHTLTGEFLNGMKDTPVFREYLHFYKTGDSGTLKFLLSFLMFGKKLDLDYPDLGPIAFRDWALIEKDLEQLLFDDSELAALNAVVSTLIDADLFDDSIFLPRNGSGAVAERVKRKDEKFRYLAFDRKLAHVFRPTRLGLFTETDAQGNFRNIGRQASFGIKDTSREARLSFVPKSYKAYRSICMEPAAYMYAQQDVMRWLVKCMEGSPISRFCDLRDQTSNQQYAVWGSVHSMLDTIDLSAASDRVHTDIVKGAFPKRILRYLLGTRTTTVQLPDGTNRLVKKFAPMGSALCFPVQCILFSSITVIGYLMYANSWTLKEIASMEREMLQKAVSELISSLLADPSQVMRKRLCGFKVYGDDIVCDSRVTGIVMDLLAHFGFRVNESKSFVGGQCVRESCGIFAYLGEDVTPFMYRVERWQGRLSASSYASQVAAINRAGDFGYRHLQSTLLAALRRLLLRDFGYPAIPFVTSKEEFGVWTKQLQLNRYRRKYNADWQVDMERVLLVKVDEKASLEAYQSYHYDQWIRSKFHIASDDPIGGPRKKWKKIPLHAGIVWDWKPVRA